MKLWLGTVFLVALALQLGCAGHTVKYVSFVKLRIAPTDHAVSMSGSFDEAKACFDKAQLPHNTPRQQYELQLEGLRMLTTQLGSHDYVLIGEVFGGGNAWANQETLTQELCKKAARNGGDVVMVFRQATIEQPYVYTTPGYSTTNANVSAYGYGNYATAHGTSHTTYTPGHTYAGVMYKPQANGFVFKLVPGVDAARLKLMSADDESLAKALAALDDLSKNSKLSWDEVLSRRRAIVETATGQTLAEPGDN